MGGSGNKNRSRRRRRSRGGQGRPGGNSGGPQEANGNRQPRGGQARRKGKPKPGHVSKQAANTPSPAAGRYFTGQLNAFELFCAYHLGLDRDGKFRKCGMNDIASRFSTDPGGIEEALGEYNMERRSVSDSAFDLELARLDVQIVPPGIDRVEIARDLFVQFLDAGLGVGPVPKANARAAASEAD